MVAGAGAGKTETMAARVVWLVANGFAAPDQVLGLTFTRKAAQQLSQRIRQRLETLAGIPSIIFGLFGYALFVSTLQFGWSLLSASLAGACLVLPTIIRTTEEALLTVPDDYRRGSLALGATKWQTLHKVVLPAALPGIITGIVLSVGRIISETAVFFVTLGGSHRLPTSIMNGGRTLALHLYYLAMDTNAFDKAMGTGAVLVVLIILINLSINVISTKLTAKVRGG